MLEAGTISHDVAATFGASFQLGTGSPVCGSKMNMDDPEAAVARYEKKCAKLTALSTDVREKKCFFCGIKLLSVKKRLREFESCDLALSLEKSMPPELRSVMASSGSNSLHATLTKVSTDLVILLKNQGLFPPMGGCDFEPQGFDLEELRGFRGNMDQVRGRLFGNSCDSKAAVDKYIESLSSKSSKEGELLTTFMEKVSKMIQIMATQGEDEARNSIEQEIAKLEADTEDEASSLLALDSESDFAVGAIIAIVVVILLLGMVLAGGMERAERFNNYR
jgi:hypothetical protein